jgi:hypothetical protein
MQTWTIYVIHAPTTAWNVYDADIIMCMNVYDKHEEEVLLYCTSNKVCHLWQTWNRYTCTSECDRWITYIYKTRTHINIQQHCVISTYPDVYISCFSYNNTRKFVLPGKTKNILRPGNVLCMHTCFVCTRALYAHVLGTHTCLVHTRAWYTHVLGTHVLCMHGPWKLRLLLYMCCSRCNRKQAQPWHTRHQQWTKSPGRLQCWRTKQTRGTCRSCTWQDAWGATWTQAQRGPRLLWARTQVAGLLTHTNVSCRALFLANTTWAQD